MFSIKKQPKSSTQKSYVKQLLISGTALAGLCAFFLPLLSGSNHSCPVLRERDLKRGPSAQAVPAFARKYNVDCTYCHTAWPQLNRTGYIFRRLGYRMPWEVPTVPSVKQDSTNAPQETPSAIKSTPLPPAIISGLKQSLNQIPSAEKIAEGQKVFTQMQCFTCHANGENVIDPSKPIKGATFLNKYPNDAGLVQVIRRGTAGTAMPGYSKDRLSDEQLTALIIYIRSLTTQP
jgi:mono/diheme cytochrome c family protein